MNFSEEQKGILLKYMREHVDFGRGRLRYAGENKRIMDQMWQEISMKLNSCGSGPQKQFKEWNKTWRDWKGNTLKKAADNKAYAAGTGGGPPKVKMLTILEKELLDFLTPEASGLDDIAQGGFQYLTPEQSSIKTRKLTEDATNINTFSRKVQRQSAPSTSFQAKSNCMEMEFSMPRDNVAEDEFKYLTPDHSNIKTRRLMEDATNINTSSRKVQKQSVPSTSFQAKSNRMEMEFSIPKGLDFSDNNDSDTELSILSNNNKENDETQEPLSHETKTTRILKRSKTMNKKIDYSLTRKSLQTPLKSNKMKTAETAIDLLRNKMQIKEEENEQARKNAEEQMKIEKEKLRLKEDILQFKKTKFEYMTTVHTEYLKQLENINSNIIELQKITETLNYSQDSHLI